jgi:hypothetical protein
VAQRKQSVRVSEAERGRKAVRVSHDATDPESLLSV